MTNYRGFIKISTLFFFKIESCFTFKQFFSTKHLFKNHSSSRLFETKSEKKLLLDQKPKLMTIFKPIVINPKCIHCFCFNGTVHSEIWIQTNGDKVRTITMECIVSASVQELLTTLNSFQNPMPFQNSISKYQNIKSEII